MQSARHRRKRRLRRQFQFAVGALVVTVLAGAVVVARAAAGHRVASGASGGRPSGSASGGPPATRKGGTKARRTGSPLSPGWKGSGKAVTLVFGGDVHFEGPLAARLAADPATALDGDVRALLRGADLAMTNFESALTDGTCTDAQPKQYVFYAPKTAITALRSAGITVVTEANNHGEDCGRPGLAQSLAIAKSARYPVIGIGADAARAFAPYRTTIRGQRIAIIAATEVLDTNLAASWTATASQPGLASAYQERELVAAVQAARRDSDTVVVYLHWGTETEQCPNPIQEPLARALVRAGADIVVGAHAHVQVGGGYLGAALVDYGLGNLAFYDSAPPESYSGTLRVTITGRHVDGFGWRPAEISGGLPVPLRGTAATAARDRWRELRGCTNLSARRRASLATLASETEPFSGPVVHQLAG